MDPALKYVVAELLVASLFMLLALAYENYRDSKRSRGPWK